MNKCEQCIVRQLSSLRELTRDELIRISHCKTSKIVKRGEVLFNEGDQVNGVFCIKDGVCKVSKMSENGRDQVIKLITKGDLLGERSLITGGSSNLTARALNDMEICFIPKDEIVRDLKQNNNFTMSMLKDLATSLRDADEVIVDMAQKTVKQRLAETLIHLDNKFPKDDEGYIDVYLTREDIANIIGTATESAIRILSDYKKKGLINFKGKRIIIQDVKGLERIAQKY
ncbi:MAG: Crp/Fnr family transcriptional regulator [Flavobacteriaceae bacterium]|nr:Crp/Fnr family transcriptional regulator [Flavobacteriaceae bacterium]|tara:strand:+ start:58229 stop:58915 length:687 start_codon:yes stop_codon:yes gene_type:complete